MDLTSYDLKWPEGEVMGQNWIRADMDMTQSRVMNRLRIKCFSLESWVHLNKKSGIILSHESIWINTRESTWVMSWFWINSWKGAWDELNWFKSPKYWLSHELIRFNFLWRHTWVERPKKSYEANTWVESPKQVNQVNSWVECPKEAIRNLEWISSLSHKLIRIKIMERWLSRELV